MNTLLIINPASGQGKAAREKRKLIDLLSDIPNAQVEIATEPGHAEELARDGTTRGYSRIIAAGGDGTINEVINGLGDSKIPLGVIPLGTGNVLAHDLGIPPNNITEALEIIRRNNVREVDLARADGRRFLLMAGLGLDAAVVDSVSHTLKDIWGTMAYASSAIGQLFTYTPTRFKLIFEEGHEYETEAFGVIAANCGSYAYNFKIAPEAIFDDGLLDIMVFESEQTTRLKLVGQALEAVFQNRVSDPSISYFRANRVRVESNPPVKMQLDGDVYGESPVDITVLPKALNLIAP